MTKIHLIITAANVPDAYQKRKSQYQQSIQTCLQYSHLYDTCTILECFSENEAYLNSYNTVYSKEGNPFPNKGLNEMNHLRAFLSQSQFSDHDSIIKLTGRYLLENAGFFEKVRLFQDEFDALFKDDGDVYESRGFHTFFYYMKKATFLAVANQINYTANNDRPIEWDIKNSLYDNPRCALVDRLGVTAMQGTNSEKIFSC